MTNARATSLALAMFLFLSGVCSAKDKSLTDKIWVLIRPVQCLGNPWEKEWLRKHNDQGVQYLRDHEFDVLRSYFKKKTVAILELRVKPYMKGEPLSADCNTSRGDTLYLLIPVSDSPKMVDLGYTERLPAKDIPNKK